MGKFEHIECQSYRSADLVCADGFIQKPICRGYGGCVQCGHHSEASTPNCMKEDLPSKWLKDDGAPLFYRSKVA